MVGSRYFSILYARHRNKCSDIKNGLLRNHVSDSPKCDCGHLVENVEHFFFQCHKYYEQRLVLSNERKSSHPLNTNLYFLDRNILQMLHQSKIKVTISVQKFIPNSNRFQNEYIPNTFLNHFCLYLIIL